MSDRDKWNRRYRESSAIPTTPCQALESHSHLLPQQGDALELASGRGGNALFLARHGLRTEAWDISEEALQQLETLASQKGLSITTQERDVVACPPEADSFDVIVVSRFLHRPLCRDISNALRIGGLLYYQTFTMVRPDTKHGLGNPDYLLEENELLRLFPGLRLVSYREEGLIGDTARGFRGEAWLIAQRT
jgi:cyclopropane fatty-acyl-phospholipid synthase-like methyltransferase